MASGGYYSDRSIERVRSATDIEAVIGRYVKLKRSGRSIKGLCPFHKEKTPSFFVSADRQMYHCFGCGAGGDVFSFLMNYLSFSFTEAVEELAAEAGITLEKTGRDTTRTDVFREILSEADSFYRRKLQGGEGKLAREYLDSRNLSEDTLERLGVGWAPQGSQLSDFLRDRGYSGSQLIEAGMSLRSQRNSGIYDRFRERITFPITDRRGRVISFGGRIIGKDSGDAPKYLNGPESPIYSKGDYLYGYRNAVSAARDLDMIILVEGYFDHARFADRGFDCVVATCGTALTPSQARQLGGMASSILVCYDGDAAGRRSAVRASEVIMQQGFLPRIIDVPEGMDPDDYLADQPDEKVLEMAADAGDPIRFALGLLGGWEKVRGTQKKVRVVRRLVDVASNASDPVIRETLLKEISRRTGYSMATLQEELGDLEEKSQPRRAGQEDQTGVSRWDVRILGSILLSPLGLSDPLIQFVEPEDLRNDDSSAIFIEMRRQAEGQGEEFQISRLDDSQRSLCSMIYSVFPGGSDPEDIHRLKKAILKARLQRERRDLKERLKSGTADDPDDLKRRIVEIEKKMSGM